jgi:hypothetical protein
MSVAVLNTHAFVKRLTAAGMPEAQAEVLADEQVRSNDERLVDLATKADIANMATRSDIANLATKAELANIAMKSDIANLATKAELAELKAEILKWMFGAIGFQTIIILGAVVALARLSH